MELTLTPDIESALSTQALLRGTTPEQLALKTLREMFVINELEQNAEHPQETLLDFLEGFIGVLDSEPMRGKAGISKDTGKAFTQLLIKKREQGQL